MISLAHIPEEQVAEVMAHRLEEVIGVIAAMPRRDAPVENRFTDYPEEGLKLLTRTMRIPAGSWAVSHEHRTEHPFILEQGRLTVWTAKDGVVEMVAPFKGMTLPGTQRVVYAHEDSVISTYHATPTTDMAVIEMQVVKKHERQLAIVQRCLPAQSQ